MSENKEASSSGWGNRNDDVSPSWGSSLDDYTKCTLCGGLFLNSQIHHHKVTTHKKFRKEYKKYMKAKRNLEAAGINVSWV